MSLLARFAPPSMTAEQYDAIVARLYEEGIHPAPGLELEARLQPVLADMGMDPGQPEVVEVHNVIRRNP